MVPLLLRIGGITALLFVLFLVFVVIFTVVMPNLLHGGSPTPTALASNSPSTGSPVSTFSGGRIAFVRLATDGTKRDIFVVNADGTNQQQISHDLIIEGTPSWSPDGRSLIVQTSIQGISTIVRYNVGADNRPGDAAQLTADVKVDCVFPAWSPDGQRITFQSKIDGGNYQIFVMNADGSNKKRISDGKGYAGQPAWSPDGKLVAYVEGQDATAGANRELWVAPPDGGAPRQLTTTNSSLGSPTWSPDSKTIAMVQLRGDQDSSLLVINVDGSNMRTLDQSGAIKYQTFSPSGDVVAYSKVLQGLNGVYEARVSDAATSTIRLGEEYQPTWSPDGSHLAWAGIQGVNQPHKIVVAKSDGTDYRPISQGDGDDYAPDWAIEK